MNSSCSDISVYQSDTELSHWVAEGSCNSSNTMVWVLVPSIAEGANNLKMYYGDLSKSNTSNGNLTFPVFFDDFNRSSDVWNHPSLGTYTEVSRNPRLFS